MVDSGASEEEKKMPELFWEPFFDIKEIRTRLDKRELELSEKEKQWVLRTVRWTFSDKVFDLVLSHLSEEEKKQSFSEQYCQNPNPVGLLESLKDQIEGIEEKISQLARTTEAEILTLLAEE